MSINIYNVDCIEGMNKFINDKTVDVIVTSPPYNIGIEYNDYDDDIPREEYLTWMEKVAIECKRVLRDDGSFFLNMGYKSKDPWVALEVAFRLRKYFKLQNIIHWIKSITVKVDDEYISVGHFKPINSERFINKCHEFIFHFTKSGDVELDRLAIGVPYKDKSNIKRWKSPTQDLRDRGDVWFIPYKTIKSRSKERPHPASFPLELPMMCMKLHGLEKTNLVLDPFMGIGNTAIACKRLGVDCIGFDVDSTYVKIANQNLYKGAANRWGWNKNW